MDGELVFAERGGLPSDLPSDLPTGLPSDRVTRSFNRFSQDNNPVAEVAAHRGDFGGVPASDYQKSFKILQVATDAIEGVVIGKERCCVDGTIKIMGYQVGLKEFEGFPWIVLSLQRVKENGAEWKAVGTPRGMAIIKPNPDFSERSLTPGPICALFGEKVHDRYTPFEVELVHAGEEPQILPADEDAVVRLILFDFLGKVVVPQEMGRVLRHMDTVLRTVRNTTEPQEGAFELVHAA